MKFSELSNQFLIALSKSKEVYDFDKISMEIAEIIIKESNNNKLTTIFGNGGSAADAQHWAAELTCSYRKIDRKAYKAKALTTDTSIITAWSNDKDFSGIFSRQINALGTLNGLSIGLSTSGKSKNVRLGLDAAINNNSKTILISGSSINQIKTYDMHIRFISDNTAIIQTLTQMLYHSVCEVLEDL